MSIPGQYEYLERKNAELATKTFVKKRANITWHDIAVGKRADCRDCPGARAINRLLAKGWRAEVGSLWVSLFENGLRLRLFAGLPLALSEFAGKFDQGIDVRPISFIIMIPENAARRGVFK